MGLVSSVSPMGSGLEGLLVSGSMMHVRLAKSFLPWPSWREVASGRDRGEVARGRERGEVSLVRGRERGESLVGTSMEPCMEGLGTLLL